MIMRHLHQRDIGKVFPGGGLVRLHRTSIVKWQSIVKKFIGIDQHSLCGKAVFRRHNKPPRKGTDARLKRRDIRIEHLCLDTRIGKQRLQERQPYRIGCPHNRNHAQDMRQITRLAKPLRTGKPPKADQKANQKGRLLRHGPCDKLT